MSDQPTFDATCARRWLLLAVGSLFVAGMLAILLVIARMPPFVHWVTDPLFFKRCLVVHVDLSLVVWFYAFLGCVFYLLPTKRSLRFMNVGGMILSGAGIVLLVAAVSITGVKPVLSNYVPVLDHPLFLAGLAAFGLGLVLTFLDGRVLPSREVERGAVDLPAAARPGIRAASIAFLIAALTFAAGLLATPADLPVKTHFELAFWGGGHALQFASSIAMVSVWTVLVRAATGEEVVGRRVASLLFGVMILPLLGAPLLALQGTDTGLVREGFTTLMRWGIFPVVSVFLILCLRTLKRRGRWSHPATVGFLVSASLTVLGFVLGAMIRGSNTMVPAHYHASIGAVTAAFMTVTYVLLDPLGMPLPEGLMRRFSRWQPVVFGAGQMVFAVGFGTAGMYGMARKAYGAEQAIRSTPEWIGLFVMGVGGLVAVAGGILYLTIVVVAWRHRLTGAQPGRTSWDKNLIPSTHFKS